MVGNGRWGGSVNTVHQEVETSRQKTYPISTDFFFAVHGLCRSTCIENMAQRRWENCDGMAFSRHTFGLGLQLCVRSGLWFGCRCGLCPKWCWCGWKDAKTQAGNQERTKKNTKFTKSKRQKLCTSVWEFHGSQAFLQGSYHYFGIGPQRPGWDWGVNRQHCLKATVFEDWYQNRIYHLEFGRLFLSGAPPLHMAKRRNWRLIWKFQNRCTGRVWEIQACLWQRI